MSFDAFQSMPSTPTESAPEATNTAPSTPSTPETTGQPDAAAAAISKANDSIAPKSEWQPNYKFKSFKEEQEIPEMYRSLIKDAETERQVKELFEKSTALEPMKERFQQRTEQFKQIQQAHQTLAARVAPVEAALRTGDVDSLLRALNFSEEKILQWVINKAQYQQLPPEQRRVLDEKRAAEERARELEGQASQYQQQMMELATQAKAQALDFELAKPEIKQIEQAFNARAGRPEAFRQAIVQQGLLAWHQSNGQVDLSPKEAIERVLAIWGSPANQPAPAIVPVSAAQPATPAKAPAKAASIPNVAGRQATSISKPKPKSLADLKKLAADMGSRT